MRKYILLTMIIVVVLGMVNITSCKRATVEDPDTIGPTGRAVTLTGTAYPGTLHVPETLDRVTSLITVTATTYEGKPAAGRNIFFESGGYGYFAGGNFSYTKQTNANGVASITYVIPRGTDVRIDTQVYIKATLEDEQGIVDPDISCLIPLHIIPYQQKDYIAISGRIRDQYTSAGVKGVIVELSSGEVVLSSSSGDYSVLVLWGTSQGWYGTITPTKEGVKFIPTRISRGSDDSPIYWDLYNMNFYAVVKQAIAANPLQLNFTNTGGTAQVYVYCTPDTSYNANFNTNNGGLGWILLGTNSADINYSTINGRTPMYIWIRVGANSTGQARTTNLVILATSPDNVAGTSVTVKIDQEA